MVEHAQYGPKSLVDLENENPYPFYEEVLGLGGPVRDPKLDVWLVSSYEDVTTVMKQEDGFSFHPTGPKTDLPHDEMLVRVHGGSLRRLVFLNGSEHRQLHRWWLDVLSRPKIEVWRSSLIRGIVDATFDRITAAGRAELWDDVAQRIPVRAICAILGLPHADDEFVTRAAEIIDVHAEYFDHRPNPGPELTLKAAEAADEFFAMVGDTIRERRGGDGDDVISRLWRDGAGMFENWNERDVFAQIHNLFLGGKDTTSLGIANALHVLLTTPGMVAYLRENPDHIDGFVEESLRLNPPTQFRSRHTVGPTAVGSAEMVGGEQVVPILAAANRDPRKFPHPDEVDVSRRSLHVTFGYGPRRCVGANLARAEIHEVVSYVVEKLPDMALDVDAADPVFQGRMLRAYHPLNVTFTALQPAG